MFQQQLYAIADVFGATRSPKVGDQQVGARLTDVVPSPPARRVVRGASAPSVSSGHPNPTTLVAWKFPDAPPDTPAARPDVSGFAGYVRKIHFFFVSCLRPINDSWRGRCMANRWSINSTLYRNGFIPISPFYRR